MELVKIDINKKIAVFDNNEEISLKGDVTRNYLVAASVKEAIGIWKDSWRDIVELAFLEELEDLPVSQIISYNENSNYRIAPNILEIWNEWINMPLSKVEIKRVESGKYYDPEARMELPRMITTKKVGEVDVDEVRGFGLITKNISYYINLIKLGHVLYRTDNYTFFITRTPIKTMQTLDVSLNNADLYQGCEIEEVAGRLNLTTTINEAVNIVGRNVAAMDLKGDEITLTGAMAVWSYLIVFHAVVHRFRRVYYDDGRSETVLVAAHG